MEFTKDNNLIDLENMLNKCDLLIHLAGENRPINISEFKLLFNEKTRERLLNNLIDLDGIGETQTESIESFFSNSKFFHNIIISYRFCLICVLFSGLLLKDRK